ncbi:MAG: hypothetical protein Q8P50_14155 [Bacillota bacterium]|nr:hypothetical protein [Bacillota bacterium]
MRCPSCGGRSVGRVSSGQYYCWDCCVEFSMGRKGFQIYRLEEDGTLTQEYAGPEGGSGSISPLKGVIS